MLEENSTEKKGEKSGVELMVEFQIEESVGLDLELTQPVDLELTQPVEGSNEHISNSKIPNKSDDTRDGNCRNESWKVEERGKQLDIPISDGVSPNGWFSRVERKFNLKQFSNWRKRWDERICGSFSKYGSKLDCNDDHGSRRESNVA